MNKLTAVVGTLAVAMLALLAFDTYADGNVPSNTPNATPVAVTSQQSATICAHAAAAANAQAVATINGVAGMYFYITYVESTYSAIAAPAATLMATTPTNFPGTFGFSQPMQAAVGDNSRTVQFAIPLKSASPGVATVVTGNGAVASISQNMKLCGFYAP